MRVIAYRQALRAYLGQGSNESFRRAGDLGRVALGGGLGIVDLVQVHHDALVKMVVPLKIAAALTDRGSASETFLTEALLPFEAAHRDLRAAHARLESVNQALQRSQQDEMHRIHGLSAGKFRGTFEGHLEPVSKGDSIISASN